MVSSIYKILPKKIRLGSFFIILLIILGATIEILGIGMILPILNSLIQENYLENKYINELSNFNNPNKIDFIKYCVLSLILIYFSKSLLLILLILKFQN